MKTARCIALAVALIAIALPQTAEAKTERPTVASFHAIDVTGVAHVVFTQQATQTITVTAPPALLKRLRLSVQHGVLDIGLANGPIFGSDGKLHLTITAPKLDQFDVAGVADVTVHGLTGNDFTLHLSGTGSFDLEGNVARATLLVSGAGTIDARQLHADNLTLEINGAGSVRAYASHDAHVSVSGVGSAKIAGNPTLRHVSQSGVGSVSFE